MNRLTIKELCLKINKSGWVAFYHPRKKTVSINGGREIPENEARIQMIEILKRKGSETI